MEELIREIRLGNCRSDAGRYRSFAGKRVPGQFAREEATPRRRTTAGYIECLLPAPCSLAMFSSSSFSFFAFFDVKKRLFA